MGSCLSSSCSNRYASPNRVRLVHFNGYVEDFEHPISVSQVIGSRPSQFLCTAPQLLYGGSKGLNPDTQLQPGQLYFAVPFSTLKDELSPLDMASMVKRLKARAKSHDGSPRSTSPLLTAVNRQPKRRETAYGVQETCRSVRSWKPILGTIRERSSSTSSNESNLQDMIFVTTKA